jgi:hypothetical protein
VPIASAVAPIKPNFVMRRQSMPSDETDLPCSHHTLAWLTITAVKSPLERNAGIKWQSER